MQLSKMGPVGFGEHLKAAKLSVLSVAHLESEFHVKEPNPQWATETGGKGAGHNL